MQRGEFTQVMARYRAGDAGAHEQVVALIHADLRRLARRHMATSRWVQTLNTTSLVNESYLRLISPAAQHVATRMHFLNLASRIMRQIVCDFARKRLKMENLFDPETEFAVHSANVEEEESALTQARQLVALDHALTELSMFNDRQSRVVDCRFFAAMSEEQTATALEISLRTVQRDWKEARCWLALRLRDA
jgi:RNA polymerase sigma factor (TIGR02999 family)